MTENLCNHLICFLSGCVHPEGKRLMQPFKGQLLLELRRATIMALRFVGVLLAESLLLHVLAERRILLTRLVCERPTVLDLVRSMHIMVLLLSLNMHVMVEWLSLRQFLLAAAVLNLVGMHVMVLRLGMSMHVVVLLLGVSLQRLLVVYVARLGLQAVAADLQLMVVVCCSRGRIVLRLQLCVLHLCKHMTRSYQGQNWLLL